MEQILDIVVNNGALIGILAYMIYKDNKFMNNVSATLIKLQDEIDDILKHLERK